MFLLMIFPTLESEAEKSLGSAAHSPNMRPFMVLNFVILFDCLRELIKVILLCRSAVVK